MKNVVRLSMATYEGYVVIKYYGEMKTKKEMTLLERAKKYSSDECYVVWRQDTDGTISAYIRLSKFDRNGEPEFDSERQRKAITNLLVAWSERYMKTVRMNMRKKK